jgi:hypothetical protein
VMNSSRCYEGGAVPTKFQKYGGGGTVCSNGFYADISNHHQMQQYKTY